MTDHPASAVPPRDGNAPRPGPEQPDAARLGNPSFVWRSGQERRLALIERYVSLNDRRVLDLGCGLGEYVRAFARRGAHAFGSDIALDRLVEARERVAKTATTGVDGFMAAAGESLPFRDRSLDVIVLNEVIEHVADDRATLVEIARVLKPGGTCVLYAPNRLYPFETHGIYLRGRYIFGNIPLVNWLPSRLRDRLVPHARAYRHGDWRRLIEDTPLRIVDHTYVYPGFDNIEARSVPLAKAVRAFCYWAEHNPLRRFGLSHLVVLRRDGAAS
ncbi:MAG: methyltransferase domain-containing protein [Chloroflexi bacterium]|nr:methyltransferase domain-containing protein [Chloroflexota bacterium]MDA1240180.1 methyltransferase domain-containing protein [Chloroflexota bacterium]MQC48281.1 class I SAM-dependent methyltransferase [Chloroflexota bacterium]